MTRELQKINFIAIVGAFLCAAASFFFIPYPGNKEMLTNSSILTLITIPLFLYGVIQPDRDVIPGKKTGKATNIFMMISDLFNKRYSAELMTDSDNWVFRRTWNPWCMFVALLLGLAACVPVINNSNRTYLLCILGYGFFFVVLFALSIYYQYFQSEENGDDRFVKSSKWLFWLMGILLISGGSLHYMEVQRNDFGSQRYLKQWNETKNKQQPKIYNDEFPSDISCISEEEKADIIASLQKDYGKEILYRFMDKGYVQKDYENRYYSELMVAVATGSSDDVDVYMYRKYHTENDEYEKNDVILFTVFKSETMKKLDLFPLEKDLLFREESQSSSETTKVTDENFITNNCMFDDNGNLLVMGENGYEPYTYEEHPDIPASISKIIKVLDEGGNYLKLDYQDKKLFLYYGLEKTKSQIVGGNGVDIFNFNIDTEKGIVSFSVELLTFDGYIEDDYRPHLLQTFNFLFGDSGTKIYDYLMTFYDQALEDGTEDETLIDGMKVTYRFTPKHRLTVF